MNNKFQIFLQIARELNKHDVVPTIYGSLGLYRITNQQDEINDIDIIISNMNLVDKFIELEKIMSVVGFERDPYYKHEFIKGEERVGFEPEDELKEWSINVNNLKITEVEGVRFKELSAKDYLKVYNRTLQRWENKVLSIKGKVSALEKMV